MKRSKSRYLVDVVLYLSLASTLTIACTPAASPTVPVEDAGDITVTDADADTDAWRRTPTCGMACTNLRAMNCALAKPTPKGASCEAVCANVQNENAGAGFNVRCLVAAKSCADADACR